MGKHNIILLAILTISTIICFIIGLWFLGLMLLLITIIFLLYQASTKWVEKQKKEEAKKLLLMQANQSLQIIEESKNIINKSKNFKTILSRFNVIFENIRMLKKLEIENSDVTDPKPSEIEKFYLREKDKFIKEFVLEEVEINMTKIVDIMTVKTKINIANKAIMRIIEGKKEIKEAENIKELTDKEKEIKAFIHKIQFDEFLEKAKKAEFMGQKSKALNACKEALYFLQTDKIDDSLQKEEIDEIKAKISELSE